MICFIFSFCAERAIATLLSGDYEKHQRKYISSIILIISHTITVILSFLLFYEKMQMVPTVAGCMICVATSCVLFIIILIVNLKINILQSKTGSGVILYTLAFRFQVKENIRALKLAYRVLVCIGVYIFVLCIILFTLFFDVIPSMNQILIFLLENCIYLSYEKQSRSHISISILIIANILTLKISYMLFYFQIGFNASVVICSGAVVVAMGMYLTVMSYNLRLHNELKNDTARKRLKKFEKYSLAYRFQLEENLKCFELVKKVILAIGIYIVLNIFCVALINSNYFSASLNQTLVFLVENCLLLNPLLICTVTMCSVEPWRVILLQDIDYVLGGLGLKKLGKVQDIKKVPEKSKEGKILEETNIYFRDLETIVPIFGLWYEAILAKLITMAYQLKFLSPGYEIGEHVAMWTQNPKKMLILNSLDGLELLLVAGFLEWHYIFSMIFGSLSVCIERVLASMWIKHYEKNKKLYIPISLTLVTQCLTIAVSFTMFYNHVNIIAANLIWIITCILASIMHFMIKKTNKDWEKQMKNPRRLDIFTISKQFQVKENLRAIALSEKLLQSVFGVIAVGGIGVVILILELVPPFFCHFLENTIFLNPFLVCFLTMYSHPAWKSEFQKAFPSFKRVRRSPKVDVESVEPFDGLQKKSVVETNMYFQQLNDSWI
ncbi:hypothetical protein L3Y34_019043 [Caenorhabditis briggsae]|uniref:Uncharacterized protein n=2 Tax=Caenorhabditis briggsae TaxID=6238 RepID=A0AAE9DN29_CAEBR|nr:hypothetical protein L3Y34_019043 [Caenorhabditis briggsae]